MSAPPVRDAVTAVLVHGGETYITRRRPELAAFPGYWAFPGGKVDKADSEEPHAHGLLAAHPPRLMRALARELREETGFELEAAAAAGHISRISCLGEATTPAFVPLRFRTWFFRIDFTVQPALQPDDGELAYAEWCTPDELLRRYRAGQLLAVPPTRAVIERLAADPGATNVPDLAFAPDFEREVPWLEPLAGLRVLLARSNTIPPADRTNAFLIGDAGTRRVLVDPSPCDAQELERVCTVLERLGVDEVFLTHHHPDHREFADEIARRYRVPLGLSADARMRIEQQTGGRYFAGLEVKLYGEGDVLVQWLGQPVRLYAVPGHDEGQLALMPDGREWCVVGDLIQGLGTVVIASPEGSMRKYLGSLQRIIDLDPAVIVPSHGMAMGTTYRLRETLTHRLLREEQVRQRHAAGRSPEQMLPEIYPDLDPRLLPLALMNIHSHLDKLREDGALSQNHRRAV